MAHLTPNYLMGIENRMRLIVQNEMERLASGPHLIWDQFCVPETTDARNDLRMWLIDSATIKPTGMRGGNVDYDSVLGKIMTVSNEHHGRGLRVNKDELEDADGFGVRKAAHWVRQISALMTYYPQKLWIEALLAGETLVGYDGKAFFAADHPLNPFDTGLGTYPNLLTGAASGTYPGACPIDESVTVDVAITNMNKAMAYISTFKMPNGEDPRLLVPKTIIYPPSMRSRVAQIMNAEFIAQLAAGGTSSAVRW